MENTQGTVTIARSDVWRAIDALDYLMAQLRSDYHNVSNESDDADHIRRDYWLQARLRRRLSRVSGY